MTRTSRLLAALLLAAAPAFAQAIAEPGPANSGKADAYADGEVRKVDKAAGKVTIKHGPLAALDMPPMTMVFRVKDPAMLDNLKQGDAIRFKAEKVGGNYTVMELKPGK